MSTFPILQQHISFIREKCRPYLNSTHGDTKTDAKEPSHTNLSMSFFFVPCVKWSQNILLQGKVLVEKWMQGNRSITQSTSFPQEFYHHAVLFWIFLFSCEGNENLTVIVGLNSLQCGLVHSY